MNARKLIGIAAAVATAMTACGESEEKPSTTATDSSLESRLEFSETTPAQHRTVARLPAEVVVPAHARSVVSPSVESRLLSWDVVEGQAVEVGDPLATLVSPELGDLKSAAAQLRRVVAERESILEKKREAVERGYQTAQSLYDAELALSEARAQLASVRRKIRLRDRDIRSGDESQWKWVTPVSGRIDDIACPAGGLYDAQSKCVSIVDPTRLEVKVDLPQQLDRRLQQVETESVVARFSSDATEDTFEQKLLRRAASLDPATRSRAYYFGDGGMSSAGSAGWIELQVPPPENAVVVPRQAVRRLQGQEHVFVESDGERPVATEVEVVGRDGDQLLIRGIPPGTRVVTRGAFLLKSLLAFE